MNYQLAQASQTSVTYGVLVESVAAGGPAAAAGLKAGATMVDRWLAVSSRRRRHSIDEWHKDNQPGRALELSCAEHGPGAGR